MRRKRVRLDGSNGRELGQVIESGEAGDLFWLIELYVIRLSHTGLEDVASDEGEHFLLDFLNQRGNIHLPRAHQDVLELALMNLMEVFSS